MNLSSNDEGVYRALTSPLITERTLRTVRTQPKRQQPVEFFSFCYLQSFVIRSSPIASSHQDYADLLPKCSNSSDLHNIRELNLDFQHHVCLGKTIYEKGKSGWKKKKTAGQRGQFVTLERESLIGDKNYFLPSFSVNNFVSHNLIVEITQVFYYTKSNLQVWYSTWKKEVFLLRRSLNLRHEKSQDKKVKVNWLWHQCGVLTENYLYLNFP